MQWQLAQDAAALREKQLQEEVAELQQLYAEATARAAADAAAASSGSEAVALRSELARARQAVASLEDTVSDVRSMNKKLEKDKRELQGQLEASVRGGSAADALANLRRALDAERECESARMQLEAVKRSIKQQRLEDEVAVKRLEAQLEEANRTLSSWAVRRAAGRRVGMCRTDAHIHACHTCMAAAVQASTVGSKHDAATLARQLAETKRELDGLKVHSGSVETALRSEVAEARSEHSSEVALLVAKLEESVTSYNSSVGDAERMLAAKEALLRKYKAEARSATSKLQATQACAVRASTPASSGATDSR
jgi:DNA repair exonuclease SbcCD ATPase subunit